MAEFKLGRIRFVWKGDWSNSTKYFRDDVIAYGGKVYICTIGHTSDADFFTDLDIVPPKWNLVSDGQTYKGVWAPDTYYVYDDIVSYGARLYICNTVHTSDEDAEAGLEADLSKWDVYAEGLDWKGSWTTSTRYRINDLVRYGGQTYVCNALHTSAATETLGLEANQGNWDVFNPGIEYKNTWNKLTRYKINDVVTYGSGLYICTTYHTSTQDFPTDEANWEQFVQGFQFDGEWSQGRAYQKGDVVRSGGNQYIALTNHRGSDPQADPNTDWRLFSEGIRFIGEWGEDSSNIEYNKGEVVSRGGYTYLCIEKHSGFAPPNTDYWQELATGLNFRGRWLDDQEYYLGDVVRFGQNAYVCVQGHISEGDDFSTETLTEPGGGAQNSRPDQDLTGTYWNILVIGSETSVLTTDGDLVYYSGAGPTRLPIGKEGQLLEVGAQGVPEWTYYGVAEYVYYVAEHGFDGPAPLHGRTLDKPFRSIRYACEQIEKGTKNTNAAYLLELNRFFIQREIIEWTDYQVANAGVGDLFENFTYDETKCSRDMGLIVDSLIYDITHGGNVKSRDAALSYVNDTVGSPYLGQKEQTVASINYGLEVIEAVLGNTDPTVNYQVLNGDNSTAVVDQYKDESLDVESVLADITSLTGIITDAITAGVADNIPNRIQRSSLVKVSTGKYYELLPIIVPAETCILGDELRSTNVQPRKSENTTMVDIFDSQFSYRAIERLENIAGDVVKGVTVTPTTGNTATQSQEFPFAQDAQATGVAQALRTIRKEIDFGLGQKLEAVLPNPVGFDDNYGRARDLIKINKTFIQAEVLEYITNNYPNVYYSKTKCKQDIGYILDAISYDLTYGGNWQSVNAGNAYFAGSGGSLQIDTEEKLATIAAYQYLKDIIAPISRDITVSPTEQTTVPQIPGTGGSVGAATAAQDLIDDIIQTINTGTAPAITYPVITAESAPLQADNGILLSGGNQTTIKNNVISFISTNFPDLTYDQAKCERDLELISTAAAYDAVFGSNFASIVAGYAYRRTSSNKVYGDQREATYAANVYAAAQYKTLVNETETDAALDFAFQYANDMIFAAATNEGSNVTIAEPNNHHAVRQLELNKDFMVAEVHAWIDEFFKDTVTATDATTDTITISDTTWLSRNMPIEFESPGDSTSAAFNSGLSQITYYVKDIVSSTEFTVSEAVNGTVVQLTENESVFTVKAVYDYDEATCARDVVAYIDALKWDLIYPARFDRNYTDDVRVIMPSNYKSKLAARYYVNSVLGCKEEDFFYLRNATGLRMMTVDGLDGDLGPANEYGTRRPTAGAYASLDPGWGPDDRRVWITARSPYVQNVTTFGNAAVGQKIDGALHNGGNDSIVSNDFTQVISDGIGAWLLNNGRAEMVSVFTYYSYIGYLCESGGRARATNGNNSYGTFGSVAEGVDAQEVPVTAIVDNKFQYSATVSEVVCDGEEILTFEYSHAGNEYTEAEFEIFGAGADESLEYTEKSIRDDAIFQARITQLNDSTGLAGGSGYSVFENTAQAGTTSQLTLAATDGSVSSAYVGMKLVITGGAGVGQYAIIDTYNAGSKIATVITESTGVAGWDHFRPGTPIIAPNSSSTYRIEPNVTFSSPPIADSETTFSGTNTWSDIEYFQTSANYASVSATGGTGNSALFDVDKVGSKYYVTVVFAGAGYTRLDEITIPGTSVGGASPLNDITLTLTTVDDSGGVVVFDTAGIARTGLFVAIGAGTTASTSIDGVTWSSMTMPASGGTGWRRLAYGSIDDGSTFLETTRLMAVTDNTTTAAYSDDGTNWTTFTISSGGTNNSVAFGDNLFVIISSNSQDVHVSNNGGITWTTYAGALPSTGYTDIKYGGETFMAMKPNSTEIAYSTNGGQTWSAGTLPASRNWTDLEYGNGQWIIINDGNINQARSIDNGQNWIEFADGFTGERLTYGQGVWVATTSSATERVYWSDDGVNWNFRTGTFTGTPNVDGPVAFGNPNQTGMFVTSPSASTNGVYIWNIGARARGRVSVASEQIFEVRLFEPGSGYTGATPTITITDPGNINDATFEVRVGKGALSQPEWGSRGVGFEAADADIVPRRSNGFADFFQSGLFVAVRQLTERPVNGSNVEFGDLPGVFFKLVNSVSFLGTEDGSYSAFLQLSPDMEIDDAPSHGSSVTMRIRFSQVRLTGHDFLDIGTGNFTNTNYPGTPLTAPNQESETVENDGGRVFFTATDQDGNFRVGDLFSVEQSTGVATLNAEAFNIAGLQELTLGEVTLGGNSASITEFSTDPFFTANSDTVVPTQRAIKAYIEAQIGGGGASLNVNSVTAGDIFIANNVITTIDSSLINIKARVNFQGGVTGLPLAYNYMLR